MFHFNDMLTKFLYNSDQGYSSGGSGDADSSDIEDYTTPKFERLEFEPIMGIKDGQLVLVFRHEFSNIPSWVEWDKERSIIAISHMNGDTIEAPLKLKDKYLAILKETSKILLVSQVNGEHVAHYVSLLTRV